MGEELLLLAHEDRVTAASFSPDGDFIATASGVSEGILRIWDARTGVEITTHTQELQKRKIKPKSPKQQRQPTIFINDLSYLLRPLLPPGRQQPTIFINDLSYSPDGLNIADWGR